MRLAVAKRNTMLNAIDAAWDGAKLRVYSGTRPTDADTALSGNTLLAELTLAGSGAGMGAASAGTITAGTITGDSSADATGTASFARIVESDGTTAIGDLSVTATGGGGELQFSTLSFVATVAVNVTSLTVNLPVGA